MLHTFNNTSVSFTETHIKDSAVDVPWCQSITRLNSFFRVTDIIHTWSSDRRGISFQRMWSVPISNPRTYSHLQLLYWLSCAIACPWVHNSVWVGGGSVAVWNKTDVFVKNIVLQQSHLGSQGQGQCHNVADVHFTWKCLVKGIWTRYELYVVYIKGFMQR